MMKKIIELAERYFELDQNPPCKDNSKESAEAREKWADTIWNIEQEIGDRIARRRELEATPITEDWLKEHGWKEDTDGWWCRKELILFPTVGGYWGIYDTGMRIHSLADLYDAMELCGITMEDEI